MSGVFESGKPTVAVKPVDYSDISSDNEFKLGCWFIHQSTTPFVVIVKKNATVHELKILIKKENEHPLPAHSLDVWKVNMFWHVSMMRPNILKAILAHSFCGNGP